MPTPLLPDRLEYLLRDNSRSTNRFANGGGLLDVGDPSGPPVVQNLALTSATRRDAQGRDTAEVGATWDPVPAPAGEDADVRQAGIRDYLFSHSTTGGASWSGERSTTATGAVIHGLPVGILVSCRVRARTTAGVLGPFTTASINTARDLEAPGTPSTPTLGAGVLKGLRIQWDGLTAAGAAMPPDLRWLEVGVGTSPAAAQSDAGVVGTMAPRDRIYTYPTPDYQTYHVALRAVDNDGNKSAWSGTVSGKGEQAVDDDLAETIRVEAAAYGTFGGGNGVRNSGFEAKAATVPDGNGDPAGGGPDPFQHYTLVQNAYAVGSGYKGSATCARLDRSGGQAAYVDSNTIPVSEVGGCVASVFVRLNNAGMTPRVQVYAVDGGSSPVVKGAGDQPIDPIDPNLVGVWQRIAVAHSSKRRADVRVRVALDGGPAGTVDVDALQYEEGDYLTAYAPMPDEILPGTIGPTEIGPNSVSTEKLVAFSIVSNKIQTDAIGAREIRANAITAAEGHLEDAVVVNAKIRNAAVDSLKVGEAQITSAHIAELTAERITTGVLRSTTRILLGGFGGNRIEINESGIYLVNYNSQGFDVTTVAFDRYNGSGYFRGTVEASTIIGNTIESGYSGHRVRISDRGNQDRVQFIRGPEFGANFDYVCATIASITGGVLIDGSDTGGGGRVLIGSHVSKKLDQRARRVVRTETPIRVGRPNVQTNSSGFADVPWPGGSFPNGLLPSVVDVTVDDNSNGAPVTCGVTNFSEGGFRVYFYVGGSRVSASRFINVYAEAVHYE